MPSPSKSYPYVTGGIDRPRFPKSARRVLISTQHLLLLRIKIDMGKNNMYSPLKASVLKLHFYYFFIELHLKFNYFSPNRKFYERKLL